MDTDAAQRFDHWFAVGVRNASGEDGMTRDELIGYLSSMDHDAKPEDFWPLIVQFVAEWIEAQGQVHGEILPIEGSSLAAKWRDEMTAPPSVDSAPRADAGSEGA